jgi:hypothetical protein
MTDKGWSAESYPWPDEEDSSAGAGEEAAKTSPAVEKSEPPAPEAPKEPESKAPETQPAKAEAPAKPPLSEEERRALMEDPDIRAEIERRAQSRYGNLKQQDDLRRQREAEDDQRFATATDYYQREYATLPEAERAQKLLNPRFRDWVSEYEGIAAARRESQQSNTQLAQVREQVLGEGLQTWNVEAARAFGQHASTLIPFYKDLPSDLRKNLEAGSQTDSEKTWVEEYVDGLSKGFMSWHRAQLAQHEEAIRNEMRAEGGGESPVMVRGDMNREPSARDILAIHALEGFNPDKGVTEESLARAKKTLNLEY